MLGKDQHNPKRPSVDSIRTISNRKLSSTQYLVGGSTYVTGFFDTGKTTLNFLQRQFAETWPLKVNENEFDKKDSYVIVYGHLHSRSPLLEWDLQCSLKGYVHRRADEAAFASKQLSRCEGYMLLQNKVLQLEKKEQLSTKEENDLSTYRERVEDYKRFFHNKVETGIAVEESKKWSSLLRLRDPSLPLLPNDCGAFIFEIVHINGPPKRLSWSDPKIVGGRNNGKCMGDNLKLLGVCKFPPFIDLSQRKLQQIRIRLAKYGETDEEGLNNLHLLKNEILKPMMRTQEGNGKHVKTHQFPNYKFYGNRILEAARYHSKSTLYCELLSHFLPSYGQYLRDDQAMLSTLQAHFEGSSFVDEVFYGAFDYCWKKQPRQDQVEDTLRHWSMFSHLLRLRIPNLEERLKGWELRFNEWKTVYNWKQWHGDTAFELYKLKQAFGNSNCNLALRYDNSCFGGRLYSFSCDYDICLRFVSLMSKAEHTFLRGHLHSKDQLSYMPPDAEPLFLLPKQGLAPILSEYIKSNSCLYEAPNAYFVESLHCIDEPLDTIYRKCKTHLVFVGMEYWKLDTVTFLLQRFQGWNFTFHYMGWELLGSTSKSSYRLTPTLASLSAMPEVTITELQAYDSTAVEYEPRTKEELAKALRLRQDIHPLSKHSNEHGIQVVCCLRDDIEKAKLAYPRNVENPLHFYLGERVITPCGMITHIQQIKVEGRTVRSVHRERYLTCFITVKNSLKRYHPTELRLAYVLNHTDVLFPVGNVVLFGTIPDYARKQYEDYLCKYKLIKDLSYKSKEQEINYDAVLQKHRSNPLPCAVYNLLKERAKQREEDELKAYEKRKAERLETMKQALHKKQRLQDEVSA